MPDLTVSGWYRDLGRDEGWMGWSERIWAVVSRKEVQTGYFTTACQRLFERRIEFYVLDGRIHDVICRLALLYDLPNVFGTSHE